MRDDDVPRTDGYTMEDSKTTTTREKIIRILRRESSTADAISDETDIPASQVYDHLEHIRKSLRSTDETLLVAPPECRECGFDGFDDPVNYPSRCPDCKTERIDKPVFKISSS